MDLLSYIAGSLDGYQYVDGRPNAQRGQKAGSEPLNLTQFVRLNDSTGDYLAGFVAGRKQRELVRKFLEDGGRL